jgi:beta-barrel assembly-enhancing protease
MELQPRVPSAVRSARIALLAAVILAARPAAADDPKNDPSRIGSRDVGKGVNFYSLERELALGKQLAEEVERQSKILDDPIISEYINRLGQNLARNSDAKVPFSFKVVDSEELNAFALPGGYVFVNTGLIKLADDESELAGALAHEIAHVAARHMTRQATKAEIANLTTIPVSVLLGGLPGLITRQAAGLAVPMTFLSFGRKDEAEADYLGLQYLYSAGYDPTGVISLFEKMESLERKEPGSIAKLFATHPMDSDRIHNAEKEIEEILPAKEEYVVTTSEYREMRDRVLALRGKRQSGVQAAQPRLHAPGAAEGQVDKSGAKRGNSGPSDSPAAQWRELME